MRNIVFYIGFVVVVGCSKTKDNIANEEIPLVISVTPNKGQVGQKVIIEGRNFGDTKSDLLVSFGSQPAVISSFSDNEIEVILPENSGDEVVSVTVKVRGKQTSGFPFFYEIADSEQPLYVKSFNRQSGIDGDTVLVYGTGFDMDKSNLKVLFDTKETEILEASYGTIKIVVPKIYKKSVPVFVFKGEEKSNTIDFHYNISLMDSLSIVSATWDSTVLKDGIIWKSASVVVFDSEQTIHVLKIKDDGGHKLGLATFSPVRLGKTSEIAASVNAFAAINGSYFGGTNSGDHVRIDGIDINRGRDWSGYINSSVAIDNDKLSIHYLGITCNEGSRKIPSANVLAVGPSLLESYKYFEPYDFDDPHVTSRHPRSAVGTKEDGTVFFVVVDGRRNTAVGMSIKELSFFMRVLGAKNAMNLDGGGSSTLYIKGHGVVNRPTDGSERSVANVIYVK